MGWQRLNYGVWFTNLGPLAPNWWLGWNTAGGFRLFRTDAESSRSPLASRGKQIPITRQEKDGWVDFFIGQAGPDSRQRCSVIDARRRLALHYLKDDLPHLHQLDCPCEEIPHHLWQKLTTRASEWSCLSS